MSFVLGTSISPYKVHNSALNPIRIRHLGLSSSQDNPHVQSSSFENVIRCQSSPLNAMFYSHESTFRMPLRIHSRAWQLTILCSQVLTSREGGVATVWYALTLPIYLRVIIANMDRLVATLGSRSNSRRINRKAILNVNIPKTCSIIIQPEAPMALRLQSSLL